MAALAALDPEINCYVIRSDAIGMLAGRSVRPAKVGIGKSKHLPETKVDNQKNAPLHAAGFLRDFPKGD